MVGLVRRLAARALFSVVASASGPAWALPSFFLGLGDLPGGATASYPWAVSADGSVVVGHSQSGSGPEAFRWTATEPSAALLLVVAALGGVARSRRRTAR